MATTRERDMITACPHCGQQSLKRREVQVFVGQGNGPGVWRPQGHICVNACPIHPGDVDEDAP